MTIEEELRITLEDTEDELERTKYKIDECIEKLYSLSKTKEKLEGSIASLKWELNIED